MMEINEKHLVNLSTSATIPIDFEGWLIKKGDVTVYRRWFMLKGNILFYFEKRSDKKPFGLIVLEGCTIELAENDGPFSFKIVFLGLSKNVLLGAENQDGMMRWMKALTVANYNHLKITIAELQKELDELRGIIGQTTDKTSSSTYKLAGHVVNVDRFGKLFDCIPFQEIEYAKTASVNISETEPYVKFESLDYFDSTSPPNELLKLLHYFTLSIKNNFGITVKSAFSWGNSGEQLQHFIAYLKTVCEMAIEVIAKEPRLLEIDAPAYVLGDIHGNFPDIHVFEQIFWKMGPRMCPYSVVFLGDYVDRGNFGCEVVAYLFAHKVMNPKKVYLIRGNHEDRVVQKNFTFFKECIEKFKQEAGFKMWEKINQVFDVMPIAGVIDNSIFVCHGGIPPPWLCPTIETINNIPCPLVHPGHESFLAWEIMWNDPIVQDQISPNMLQMHSRQGFSHNAKRGTGHCFSGSALEKFLNVNDLSHVIRAHEVKSVGFQIQQGGKLLTVFSSSGYCGGVNEAACIMLDVKKIRIIRVNMC